jgi:hypothetical protein
MSRGWWNRPPPLWRRAQRDALPISIDEGLKLILIEGTQSQEWQPRRGYRGRKRVHSDAVPQFQAVRWLGTERISLPFAIAVNPDVKGIARDADLIDAHGSQLIEGRQVKIGPGPRR